MNTAGKFSRAMATAATLGAAVIAAGLLAAPAGATGNPGTNPESPASGHAYRHGVVPTRAQQAQMNRYAAGHGGTSGPETLSYGGGINNVGVTSGQQPRVYLVFWGSSWGAQGTDSNGNLTFQNDTYGGAPYIQSLFKGLGTAPSGGSPELWSGTMTQYCDGSVATGATSCPSGSSHILYPSNSVYAGVMFDNRVLPATIAANDIAQEAIDAANHFGQASYRDAQFDILFPPGANPDNWLNSGFCAWHDFTGDGYTVTGKGGYGDVAFTNMPYVMDAGASCGMNFVNAGSAGNLDGYSIVNGHEYAETITDQFPAGGWTNHQPNRFSGQENGDECAWISSGSGASGNVAMATGKFAMQSTWSNDTNSCALSHAIVTGSTGGGNTVSVTNPGNQTSRVNQAVSLQMGATDSGGLTLTWKASGLPRGLSISSSGLISGTPTKATTASVTVTATDSTGSHGSTSFSWTVTR